MKDFYIFQCHPVLFEFLGLAALLLWIPPFSFLIIIRTKNLIFLISKFAAELDQSRFFFVYKMQAFWLKDTWLVRFGGKFLEIWKFMLVAWPTDKINILRMTTFMKAKLNNYATQKKRNEEVVFEYWRYTIFFKWLLLVSMNNSQLSPSISDNMTKFKTH